MFSLPRNQQSCLAAKIKNETMSILQFISFYVMLIFKAS